MKTEAQKKAAAKERRHQEYCKAYDEVLHQWTQKIADDIITRGFGSIRPNLSMALSRMAAVEKEYKDVQ